MTILREDGIYPQICSVRKMKRIIMIERTKKGYILKIVAIIIFREHEINSHIGSGYDLWREDNVTREWEGIYRCSLQ